MSVPIARYVVVNECGTYLIYRVYKYLRVPQREATSHFFFILARKNGLDQGGALKGELNQTPAGYIVAVENEGSGVISVVDDKFGESGGHTALG